MGVVGVGDDVWRETDGDVVGPVEWGPRTRGPLGHRPGEGMTPCVGDGCPGTQWVRDVWVGLRMGTPSQMTGGECPDMVVRCPGWYLGRVVPRRSTVDWWRWMGGCMGLIWHLGAKRQQSGKTWASGALPVLA